LKRIVMVSSIMGSIAHVSDAKSPNAIAYSPPSPPPPPPLPSNLTSHSYRSSKAALNMAMRSMALQLQVTSHALLPATTPPTRPPQPQGITCVSVHPGKFHRQRCRRGAANASARRMGQNGHGRSRRALVCGTVV
jgi:NAD(P)-dependent dehydrogenase (short-subunit alcohol dehydrogenase family)